MHGTANEKAWIFVSLWAWEPVSEPVNYWHKARDSTVVTSTLTPGQIDMTFSMWLAVNVGVTTLLTWHWVTYNPDYLSLSSQIPEGTLTISQTSPYRLWTKYCFTFIKGQWNNWNWRVAKATKQICLGNAVIRTWIKILLYFYYYIYSNFSLKIIHHPVSPSLMRPVYPALSLVIQICCEN